MNGRPNDKRDYRIRGRRGLAGIGARFAAPLKPAAGVATPPDLFSGAYGRSWRYQIGLN